MLAVDPEAKISISKLLHDCPCLTFLNMHTVQDGACILLAMLLPDEHQSLENLCFYLVRLIPSLPDNRRKTVELRLSVKHPGSHLLLGHLTCPSQREGRMQMAHPESRVRWRVQQEFYLWTIFLSSFYQTESG